MAIQELTSNLQSLQQKLAKFRKTNRDKTAQRVLADRTINHLRQLIKPIYLEDAFINNNIQPKSAAVKKLQNKLNQLKQTSHPNKKTAHDLKKAKANLEQVQNFTNQWINFTGNGKAKQLNLKTLINAVQELIEYL